MLLNRLFQGFVIMSLLVTVMLGGGLAQAQEPEPLSANVSTFVTGLVYPRGLEFGPDGSLYVAEAGPGGDTETNGDCPGGYVSPFTPYHIGMSGQVAKISSTGERTTVVEGLPAARDKYGDVIGPNDVAFLGDTLYVLSAGGGCSRGMSDTPTGVVRGNADRTWTEVGDLSAFYTANPTAAPLDDDYEPDGGTYGLTAVDGKLYIVDANHAEFDEITLDGQIRRVLDMSASEGHITPTALTFHDGAFYIGNLGEFPIQQGTSKIFKVTPDGQMEVFAEGLTAVLGLAFDSQGQLYALEASTVDNNLPVPGAGRVVRVGANGALEPVATGLTFPGGLTFGPDGKLYISNFSYGGEPSKGEILRIDVAAAPATSSESVTAPATSSESATAPAALPTSGGVTDPILSVWLVLLTGAGMVGVGWRLRGKKKQRLGRI